MCHCENLGCNIKPLAGNNNADSTLAHLRRILRVSHTEIPMKMPVGGVVQMHTLVLCFMQEHEEGR